MGNSMFAMGVIASIHVHMMEGGGSNFGHFGVYILIE